MKFSIIAAAAALALGMVGAAGASGAQDITKPECVAPAKPGGGFDLTCRIAQAALKDAFGTPLQVTFMPGGIGAVAINVFNTTRTDDPNAIVAFSSGSLLNIATGKYGKWNEKDVRWLATAGADFGAVVVRDDSPYKSLDDLMKAVAENESGVIFGAGGSVGSQDWMKAALLLKSRDLDPRKMRYVAYDGGGAAIAGLLGGAIKVYMGDVGEMVPYMGAHKLRVLAVMSDKRLPAPFADTPTAKELGYDAEWTILRGYYMGKDVPDAVYDAWVKAFQDAYKTPEFAKIQKDKGLMPLDLAGEELSKSIEGRVAKMRQVAKDAGLIK
jgi:putative tricarboxylic transport membrane protein